MNRYRRRQRQIICLLAALLLCSMAVMPALPAAAFGSRFGSHVHQMVTTTALTCHGPSDSSCFEPQSLRALAADVAMPDYDETSLEVAHCDNADWLKDVPRRWPQSGGITYPLTRGHMVDGIVGCVRHFRMRFKKAVEAASYLVVADLVPERASIDKPACASGLFRDFGGTDSAKCRITLEFARALHGVEDFYSHTNYADQNNPSLPLDIENPPGLGLSAPSPLLDLRSAADIRAIIPADLTSECFDWGQLTFEGYGGLTFTGCSTRVKHLFIAKDDETYARARINNNFATVTIAAAVEVRRQWSDFRAVLEEKYGKQRAALMACILTHDRPSTDCYTLKLVYQAHLLEKEDRNGEQSTLGLVVGHDRTIGLVNSSVALHDDSEHSQHSGAAPLVLAAEVPSAAGTPPEPIYKGSDVFTHRKLVLAIRPPYYCDGTTQWESIKVAKPGELTVHNWQEIRDTHGELTDYIVNYEFTAYPEFDFKVHAESTVCPYDTVGTESVARILNISHDFSLEHGWDLTDWVRNYDPADPLLVARKETNFTQEIDFTGGIHLHMALQEQFALSYVIVGG